LGRAFETGVSRMLAIAALDRYFWGQSVLLFCARSPVESPFSPALLY
jgi:hypothetical protein